MVSSLVGVDMRSTMDIDTTVKSLPLNKDSAQKILEEVKQLGVEAYVVTAELSDFSQVENCRLFHFGYPPQMRKIYLDGGKELSDKIDSFKVMIGQVRERYPNAQICATTLRQVISANEHLWGAILWADGKWFVEEPRPIQVMDRIGGGDGFSGGLLYAVLQGWDAEKWLQFGWASGVLAASSLNDYAEPADEKQVWDVYKGNARVQR